MCCARGGAAGTGAPTKGSWSLSETSGDAQMWESCSPGTPKLSGRVAAQQPRAGSHPAGILQLGSASLSPWKAAIHCRGTNRAVALKKPPQSRLCCVSSQCALGEAPAVPGSHCRGREGSRNDRNGTGATKDCLVGEENGAKMFKVREEPPSLRHGFASALPSPPQPSPANVPVPPYSSIPRISPAEPGMFPPSPTPTRPPSEGAVPASTKSCIPLLILSLQTDGNSPLFLTLLVPHALREAHQISSLLFIF